MTTTASPQPLIHLAMLAILGDIEAIAKDRENTGQGFKFRGIDDIINELHPIFRAHGVFITPRVINRTSRDAGMTKNGTLQTRAEATFGYRFVAKDGSFVEAEMIGEGVDSGDKASPKAASMALKYALIQTFLIPTADVVDADYYTPTIDARSELAARAGDRKAMQAILDQHMADAELANTEGERRRLHGLAAEMRCKIADLDVTPTAESQSGEATAAPAAEVPPAGQNAPAQPKTRTRKPAAIPWQEVECHIGKAGGSMLGKKIGDLFKPDRTETNIKSLMDYFQTKVGNLTAPSAKDAALWDAVQAGHAAWKAAQTGGEAKEQKPETKKEAVTTNNWRAFKIESKNKDYDGRTLGDLSPDEIAHVAHFLDRIDWPKATIYHKKLKANFDLAMAEELEKHLPPKPEHTAQLREALAASKIDEKLFLERIAWKGWIPQGQPLEAITEKDVLEIIKDWKTVEETCDDIP